MSNDLAIKLKNISDRAAVIRQNIASVKNSSKDRFNEDVEIVAAVKTFDADTINLLPKAGIYTVGENRVQEIKQKFSDYDAGLDIHFIGQLQTNKVKDIITKVSLIQSLDRINLAEVIDAQAKKNGITMNVLIEVNCGKELTKGGIEFDKVIEFAKYISSHFLNIIVCGLMSVMPIDADEKLYLQLRELYDKLKSLHLPNSDIKRLSMGMSGDYLKAIKCGSNMIRLGRAIMGERIYRPI